MAASNNTNLALEFPSNLNKMMETTTLPGVSGDVFSPRALPPVTPSALRGPFPAVRGQQPRAAQLAGAALASLDSDSNVDELRTQNEALAAALAAQSLQAVEATSGPGPRTVPPAAFGTLNRSSGAAFGRTDEELAGSSSDDDEAAHTTQPAGSTGTQSGPFVQWAGEWQMALRGPADAGTNVTSLVTQMAKWGYELPDDDVIHMCSEQFFRVSPADAHLADKNEMLTAALSDILRMLTNAEAAFNTAKNTNHAEVANVTTPAVELVYRKIDEALAAIRAMRSKIESAVAGAEHSAAKIGPQALDLILAAVLRAIIADLKIQTSMAGDAPTVFQNGVKYAELSQNASASQSVQKNLEAFFKRFCAKAEPELSHSKTLVAGFVDMLNKVFKLVCLINGTMLDTPVELPEDVLNMSKQQLGTLYTKLQSQVKAKVQITWFDTLVNIITALFHSITTVAQVSQLVQDALQELENRLQKNAEVVIDSNTNEIPGLYAQFRKYILQLMVVMAVQADSNQKSIEDGVNDANEIVKSLIDKRTDGLFEEAKEDCLLVFRPLEANLNADVLFAWRVAVTVVPDYVKKQEFNPEHLFQTNTAVHAFVNNIKSMERCNAKEVISNLMTYANTQNNDALRKEMLAFANVAL